ncbi:MAG: GNAT family N-acetyltransferase [Pseudomonadales bacterium]|nr:GNAT family N-acetyltransferase [Pseudomonadales bacterium]NRA18005.1 GNAT family N-acetyltransferase [Oceanospirillaceae bacterium]
MSQIQIETATADNFSHCLAALSDILYQCVLQGASVGFIQPFDQHQSSQYWQDKVLPDLATGAVVLYLARIDTIIVGCVQLGLATPANQTHRAEVAKLLVHPQYQRRGIARKLLMHLESQALRLGRSLLTLDTKTGDSAEPLYLSMGFISCGTIPNFAKDPVLSRLDATTIMYKNLRW